ILGAGAAVAVRGADASIVRQQRLDLSSAWRRQRPIDTIAQRYRPPVHEVRRPGRLSHHAASRSESDHPTAAVLAMPPLGPRAPAAPRPAPDAVARRQACTGVGRSAPAPAAN